MKRTIAAFLLHWLSLPRIILLTLVAASFLLVQYDTPAHENLTAEERCGYQPGQFDKTVPDNDAVEITVWARANGAFCWRAFLPVEAAKLVTEYKIVVQPRALAAGSGADADRILPAASKGEGPDIAYLGNQAINHAYDLGYIEPLDACLDRYPEYDTLQESAVLWSPLTRDGKRLGLPIEPTVYAFFFSKDKLRDLGWSKDQIDQLPLRIREGQFTLDDMADVARQAVDKGKVQSGLGYWPSFRPRPTLHQLYKAFGGDAPKNVNEPFHLSRAVLERVYAFNHQLFVEGISHPSLAGQEVGTSFVGRTLYQDTVAHGKVLFWSRELTDWTAEYAANFVDELGGREYVSKTIGYALFPSAVRGQPGSTRWSNTGAYVILSARATGRQNQDLACAVLAKVMIPEIYSRFSMSTSTLSVLRSQNDDSLFGADSFPRDSSYFWDYIWRWPQDTNSDQYLLVLEKYLVEVELGRLSPKSAVDTAVREIQEELGSVVIIEP
jgi:inositol-phosphate transport system substrate-binding protein